MLVDEVDVDVVDEVVLMLMLCGLNGEHRKLVSSSKVERTGQDTRNDLCLRGRESQRRTGSVNVCLSRRLCCRR